MFWKRLLSGIVLAALLLMLVGDIWLLFAVGILSLLGIYELLRVFGLEKHPFAFAAYAGTLLFDLLLFPFNMDNEMWTWAVLILVFVVTIPSIALEL